MRTAAVRVADDVGTGRGERAGVGWVWSGCVGWVWSGCVGGWREAVAGAKEVGVEGTGRRGWRGGWWDTDIVLYLPDITLLGTVRAM